MTVGLLVGAEGAVGGGQRGALALRTDHSRRPLQAGGLALLTGREGQAVGDVGLWPHLQGATEPGHIWRRRLPTNRRRSRDCWTEAHDHLR